MRIHSHIFFISLSLFLFVNCAPKPSAPAIPRKGTGFSFFAPSAARVSIVGSFNRWDPERDRLAGPDGKGVWTIVLPLPPGRYEYRFVINNGEWALDPAMPSTDDGLGDKNSLVIVPP